MTTTDISAPSAPSAQSASSAAGAPGTASPTTAERYAALSHRQARQGDVRRAQLAAWAADVHVLEELLWENGLGEAPDPYEQLAAIGEAVATALEALAAEAPDDLSPREVVELARHAMVTTFDASVHELLEQRLADLDHLEQEQPGRARPDQLRPGASEPGASEPGRSQRVQQPADPHDDRAPEELVAELRTAAADCMAVAHLMAAEGEPSAALRMARQSDTAAFEAYLVTAAVAAGDTDLATVDLRWQLALDAEEAQAARAAKAAHATHAAGTISEPNGCEPGPEELRARRDLLSSLVGSAERPALDAVLEQW